MTNYVIEITRKETWALQQQSYEFEKKIKKAKSESDNKVGNLYCELQIRDIKLKDANDDMCSLQEKLKALEADRSELVC